MKNLKFILISIISLAFFTQISNAKKVTGTITDVTSGKPIPNVLIELKNSSSKTYSDADGNYVIQVTSESSILVFSHPTYEKVEKKVGSKSQINIQMILITPEVEYDAVEVIEYKKEAVSEDMAVIPGTVTNIRGSRSMATGFYDADAYEPNYHNTEEYDVIIENGFRNPVNEPLSTFSIDVDAASYSNLRRMINNGTKPHKDVVRIEEMINYFNYDYDNPNGQDPFSINTEVSTAPWNNDHYLVHIGLQGKMIDYEDLNPSNLVFLIDVSGSMNSPNKLSLLRSSMKLLVNSLQPNDRVAIVVYAGAAGLVLPSTPVSEKEKIISSLDQLQAGGSTAGGAGIKLAYKVAQENLIEGGNNRVILATDGDFNVGPSSTAEMVRLIQEKRDLGIFLTITGFGMGNYKDGRMEQISNAGNGNYFYIDNIGEARKVFVREMRATLFTIAKDVKIQVEFNPNIVQSYRLIGYENRKLNNEDFNNDKIDAGELGAGHTVTALYEIIPVGIKSDFLPDVDPLKYQVEKPVTKDLDDEILTVKFRYKEPNGTKSKLIVHNLNNELIDLEKTSDNFRFSAAVAEFGMLLRDSDYKSSSSYHGVIELAKSAQGKDENGYRFEFIKLVDSCQMMAVK